MDETSSSKAKVAEFIRFLEEFGLYDTVLSWSDYEVTFANEPVEIYEVPLEGE